MTEFSRIMDSKFSSLRFGMGVSAKSLNTLAKLNSFVQLVPRKSKHSKESRFRLHMVFVLLLVRTRSCIDRLNIRLMVTGTRKSVKRRYLTVFQDSFRRSSHRLHTHSKDNFSVRVRNEKILRKLSSEILWIGGTGRARSSSFSLLFRHLSHLFRHHPSLTPAILFVGYQSVA